MKVSTISAAAIAAASLAAMAPAAQAADAKERNCFSVTDWRGWSSPSSDTLYLRVNNRDVYRVGLVGKADGRSVKSPGSFLVSKTRGSNFVCSAIDLDLAVADDHGFRRPLFPRTLTKLTKDEVAALPARYRP